MIAPVPSKKHKNACLVHEPTRARASLEITAALLGEKTFFASLKATEKVVSLTLLFSVPSAKLIEFSATAWRATP